MTNRFRLSPFRYEIFHSLRGWPPVIRGVGERPEALIWLEHIAATSPQKGVDPWVREAQEVREVQGVQEVQGGQGGQAAPEVREAQRILALELVAELVSFRP